MGRASGTRPSGRTRRRKTKGPILLPRSDRSATSFRRWGSACWSFRCPTRRAFIPRCSPGGPRPRESSSASGRAGCSMACEQSRHRVRRPVPGRSAAPGKQRPGPDPSTALPGTRQSLVARRCARLAAGVVAQQVLEAGVVRRGDHAYFRTSSRSPAHGRSGSDAPGAADRAVASDPRA